MKAPDRLLESSSNLATLELLQAGRAERPRPAALRATALALGVSSSVVAASSTATAAAGATTALAAPSLAAIATKWVALGALGGMALAGSASLMSDWSAPHRRAVAHAAGHSPITRSTSLPPSITPPEASPARPLDDPAPVVRHLVTDELENVAPAPRNVGAPSSASLPAAQSLSREIALIDRARGALSAGSPARALAELDEYSALTRTGTLDREAQLLRIDALARSGQQDLALPLAARYLASYPNDPHAARLRALVATPR